MFRNFNQFSFWLGFIAGTLFWFFVSRLFPAIKRSISLVAEQVKRARENLKTEAELRYQNDLLVFGQNTHISSKLFSLDEIIQPPRILAPPRWVNPEKKDETETELIDEEKILEMPPDIVENTIPYLPDWPEFPTAFGAPMLSLAEALQKGANLLLLGRPGIGKTTALIHLASQIIRQSLQSSHLNNLIPIYLHSGDIVFPPNEKNFFSPISSALATYTSRRTTRSLPDMLKKGFNKGNLLLLVDGLDELNRSAVDEVTSYLGEILKSHPNTRIVAATALEYSDGLSALGLVPVAMASWDMNHKQSFADQWGKLWSEHIQSNLWELPAESGNEIQIDPFVLNQWLLSDNQVETPMEFTLKIWAAYAGDALGKTATDALEAYIRRMTVSIQDSMEAMRIIGLKMIEHASPLVDNGTIRKWISQRNTTPVASTSPNGEDSIEESSTLSQKRPIRNQVVSDLIQAGGLLVPRTLDRFMFVHPLFCGYMAGTSGAKPVEQKNIINQPSWSGRSLALKYFTVCQQSKTVVDSLLISQEPLHTNLFMLSLWIKDAPQGASWLQQVMRTLVTLLQSPTTSLGIRMRALAGLVHSGDSGVVTLCRKLLVTDDPTIRLLATLGIGYMHDTKSIADLGGMMGDSSNAVRRAACLSLVSIGTKEAIDGVITGLLEGDEELQRAAAEALSFHPAEGHEILKEATTVENLLVRRAAVFGLARIHAPWTNEILKKMAVEDGQWIVKNAALQAMDNQKSGSVFSPEPLPPLHSSPWLIVFAGQQGVGISPGKSAREMLYRALVHGNEKQKLASLDYLRLGADTTIIPSLYTTYFGSRGKLQESALIALWHLAVTGIDLPDPIQFGLG